MRHQPHILLMGKCSNQYVNRILQDIEKHARQIPNERIVTTKYVNSRQREEVLHNHYRLIDLMEEDRFEEAAEAMAEHVNLGQTEYMNYWF